MNKPQFWTLNLIGLVLAASLLAHYFWGRANESAMLYNEQLSQTLARQQTTVNNAQKVEPVLEQLVKRIAKGSETDPQLRNILVKYGLNVTLETDGKTKSYP